MNPLWIVVSLVPISVGLRYLREQSQAALLVGITLASPEHLETDKNGLQIAVRIPEASNWLLGLVALFVAGLAWLVLGFGSTWALAGIFTAAVSSTSAQALLLPRRDSQHFIVQHAGSMARRYAEYQREGDRMRATVMRHLLDRLSEEYPSAVGVERLPGSDRILRNAPRRAVSKRRRNP